MSEQSASSDGFAEAMLTTHKDLIPTPYGALDALEQSGSVATPLMAGFALTMASLVLTSSGSFRWPSMVLLLLALSVVALVMSIQAAQWTRSFRVRPEEIESWWPAMTPLQRAGRADELLKHHRSRLLWAGRQRRSYRLGLLALLGGLAVALVPPVPAKGEPKISAVRWTAVGIGVAGFAFELVWIVLGALAGRPMPRTSGSRAWIRQRARRLLGMF